MPVYGDLHHKVHDIFMSVFYNNIIFYANYTSQVVVAKIFIAPNIIFLYMKCMCAHK